MPIDYHLNTPISVEQFIELLEASTLAERRPVSDRSCMAGMLKNSNLTISAWDGDTLVGIARGMTDFHYACYLSDLAVHQQYQRSGIGKALMAKTGQQLGPRCKMILVAAPDANTYYEHLGFKSNPRCWVFDNEDKPDR
ncbi:MAG: GNAT family N-acetyltransferase [bacterium]